MPCDIADGRDLVTQLDGTALVELQHYTKLEVGGRTFGYLWEPTVTMGLRQTIAEQRALVGERPQVFESSSPPTATAGSSSTSTASSATSWPSSSSRPGA